LYLQLQNKPEQEVLAALDLRNSYALQDYKTAAQHYKLPQIKNIINLLNLYDLKAKGVDNTAPPEALLKELTFRLIVGE
jgi:DNA polymerase III delta subunit